MEHLQIFINEYVTFKHNHQMQRLAQDRTAFSGVLQGYAAMKAIYNRLNREVASDFNLFDILKIQWYETRTHTPLLHHLLQPTGTHGQGLLFYNLFLEMLGETSERFFVSTPDELEVAQEKYTTNGNIDILIKGPDFAIVIENKVNASDQPEQLTRYFEHCNKTLSLPPERILLVYLSKDGKLPTEVSFSPINNKASNCLRCISYSKNISSFLSKAIQACQSQKVKYTLEQYLETVNKISE